MKILLSAGGTAGHIFPAIALSRELKSRGIESALIGASNGMEARLAKEENLEFFGVSSGKLDRSRPDPRALLNAARGVFEASGVVRRYKPSLVVGFGGFASLQGMAGAALTGAPLAMHEANAFPGLVTRFFASRARIIALADAATKTYLKSANTIVVGMPVRETIVPRLEALTSLGLEPNKFSVLVMGGSQGSLRLNTLLPSLLERVLTGKNAQVLHQTGRGRLEEVAPKVAHLPWYKCAEFVDGAAAFSAADFAITRAGMSTIADAAFHGVPLALIPLPSSAENHQVKNAQALESRGAGLCILESDLEQEVSGLDGKLVSGMLSCFDTTHLANWREIVQKNSPKGAAKRLADALLEGL
jgi:UDP-N-acetylglucosamine--N-acetylmuramyl-(pentapeptide) pyrophosphoryl-undecaprenol N-acetylglucosamine transferase